MPENRKVVVRSNPAPAQQYEVVLISQPEGGFVVTVPDLPDFVSEGETREEALAMIRDAIEGYLETLRERGWPLRMGERLPLERRMPTDCGRAPVGRRPGLCA